MGILCYIDLLDGVAPCEAITAAQAEEAYQPGQTTYAPFGPNCERKITGFALFESWDYPPRLISNVQQHILCHGGHPTGGGIRTSKLCYLILVVDSCRCHVWEMVST